MKNKTLFIFQLTTLIIIVLLTMSTFFIQQEFPDNYSHNWFVKSLNLDHYYHSPLNIILFSIIAIFIIISIFTGTLKSKGQVILHIIIVLSFITIVYDKTMNMRVLMPLLEGESVQFSKIVKNKNYDQQIELEQFIIKYHNGSRMPSAFTSKLKIDADHVELNVNKPVKIGHYHLYQNSYDRIPVYTLIYDEKTYSMIPEDTITVDGNDICLIFSDDFSKMDFHYNDQKKNLSSKGGKSTIDEFEFNLFQKGSKFISGIEVASVQGMRLLLFLGLGYLASLGYCFWRKK